MQRMIGAIAFFALSACRGQSEAPSTPFAGGAGAPSPASAAASARAPSRPARAAPVREGGTIARAVEGDALFVADEDHGVIRALELPVEVKSKRADFRTPGRPAQVLVTRDRVLVTIRQIEHGEGALLVLRRKPGLELEEIGRVSLPVDAWGIALTPDEGTALVTSAWAHRVTAVDLAKLAVTWSVDVAREPRGVVALRGDRAYVSHLVGSDVTRIDGLGEKEPKVKRVELPAAPLRSSVKSKFPASLGYAVVASPAGDRVFFPRHAPGALGSEAWSGAGAVDVLASETDTALAPPRAPMPTGHFVATIAERFAKKGEWDSVGGAVPVIEANGLSAPRAIAYRKKTDTLLVADEGGGVVELDARALDPTLVVAHGYSTSRKPDGILGVAEHGEAPSGVALSEDEDTAWVFCRAADDVVVLDLPPDDSGYRSAPRTAILLGPPDEDKELRVGRALFYDASNQTVSGGMSCAGCHPEGRDDGEVWREVKLTQKRPGTGAGMDERHFTNFLASADVSAIEARWGDINAEGEGGFGYARRTPILAGRVKAKGPYGWHGESPDLAARIIAGFGLHRWGEANGNTTMSLAFATALARFIREGLVPPPRLEKALTEEETRGKAIFVSPATQCSKCHPPEHEYTDRSLAELGKLAPPRGFAVDPSSLYKVPSLLFVGESAPYMHDGRFESLESLLEFNQDRMGKTAQLSADERRALIAFLRTL